MFFNQNVKYFARFGKILLPKQLADFGHLALFLLFRLVRPRRLLKFFQFWLVRIILQRRREDRQTFVIVQFRPERSRPMQDFAQGLAFFAANSLFLDLFF